MSFKKACLFVCLASLPFMAQAQVADLSTLIEAAKKEGQVNSVGMPDSWANWKDTWSDLKTNYGLEHQDTDMSSAQEIAKFAAEKENATADIGDVGQSFGPIAVEKGVTQTYKPSTWDEIPAWAKDEEGHWAVAYTGAIAFMVNNETVKEAPKSWADLVKGNYKVTLGDVGVAAQANNAVLAAAVALGGNEKDVTPALKLFAELAKQKRLSLSNPSLATLEKGEVEVGVLWDFNALNYRDQIDPKRFTVVIPEDGSIMAGYATIINKYAKNPNAAKLAREYIFSDAGQDNLAKGYARPIRDKAVLSEEAKSRLLPAEAYKNVQPIKDQAAWDAMSKKLPELMQEHVLIY
ncbi:MAG: ABC transporter substrate-binding protein [Alcaligenaceae bacterium]|nr:ABC transporter substrate-binding protein [Alcaligenaceae bacterium]